MSEFESTVRILGEFAKGVPADSREYQALKHAVWAVIYSHGPNRCDEFRAFVANANSDLTPEQSSKVVPVPPDRLDQGGTQ